MTMAFRWALLRHGNAGPAESGTRMVREVVQELRLRWPKVRIELTADAGFCTPELYEYCEANEITYFIGIKGNSGLTPKCQKSLETRMFSSSNQKSALGYYMDE
jgi:hypothetical protein